MALFFVFLIGMGISFAVHDTSSTILKRKYGAYKNKILTNYIEYIKLHVSRNIFITLILLEFICSQVMNIEVVMSDGCFFLLSYNSVSSLIYLEKIVLKHIFDFLLFALYDYQVVLGPSHSVENIVK